ncbi:hypothetical protein HNP55_004568 [Paucibacter oligotrophus]|uniref:Uncharacterized protein n=1 Tax=Roseateles oligotrophus TaxID=1769250 RepID=A0A840LBN5_9BURK|nr:hypothetical protein [Roseateles oligotrophus]MBB4846014.1 hypothetical protein [Roseateles oligotrophus]
MPYPVSERNVAYICEQMLHVSWKPRLGTQALDVLSLADSLLEQAFFLGAWHYLETKSREGGGPDRLTLNTSQVDFGGRSYLGLWLVEPWFGWYQTDKEWGGPSALMFVPQLQSATKEITHDFGLFYGDDNGQPRWKLHAAIEVDGYAIHQGRRPADELRDTGLPYKVLRLYEESDKPLDWFRKIVELDARARDAR